MRGSNTELAAKPKRPSLVRAADAATAPAAAAAKPRDIAPPKAKAVVENPPAPAVKWPDPVPPKAVAPVEAPKPRLVKQADKEETPRAPEREMRTAFSAPPASSNGLLAGRAPVVPVGSFGNRFSGVR